MTGIFSPTDIDAPGSEIMGRQFPLIFFCADDACAKDACLLTIDRAQSTLDDSLPSGSSAIPDSDGVIADQEYSLVERKPLGRHGISGRSACTDQSRRFWSGAGSGGTRTAGRPNKNPPPSSLLWSKAVKTACLTMACADMGNSVIHFHKPCIPSMHLRDCGVLLSRSGMFHPNVSHILSQAG